MILDLQVKIRLIAFEVLCYCIKQKRGRKGLKIKDICHLVLWISSFSLAVRCTALIVITICLSDCESTLFTHWICIGQAKILFAGKNRFMPELSSK